MSETGLAILSAVITGLFSLWGVYAANRKSQALMEYRMERLEDKVDKHNKVVERTFVLEGKVTELEHHMSKLAKGA